MRFGVYVGLCVGIVVICMPVGACIGISPHAQVRVCMCMLMCVCMSTCVSTVMSAPAAARVCVT
jgi:hypothetical protein